MSYLMYCALDIRPKPYIHLKYPWGKVNPARVMLCTRQGREETTEVFAPVLNSSSRMPSDDDLSIISCLVLIKSMSLRLNGCFVFYYRFGTQLEPNR